MLENEDDRASLAELQEVILLKKSSQWAFREYADLIRGGGGISDSQITTRMCTVDPNDMCNLQFTSGTTAAPKAAMLTHKYKQEPLMKVAHADFSVAILSIMVDLLEIG